MKILNINNTAKRTYTAPVIECVTLDNEISLQLASPGTPNNGDEVYNTPHYFNNDPFKNA